MAAKSPLMRETTKTGIRVKGTRYSKAGCAEFITKRLMKVAIKPRA